NGDAACDDIFAKLADAGIEVMYDDRDERAGVKFSDMDLIGLPWQLVVGPRGVQKGMVELKDRKTGERQEMSLEAALAKVAG
ncbi:MAG: His/Gly/Thr/Pro-type tRNA ligase C-terminal domain-containing protein, partial [Alphaproteobacteria bacterium]